MCVQNVVDPVLGLCPVRLGFEKLQKAELEQAVVTVDGEVLPTAASGEGAEREPLGKV